MTVGDRRRVNNISRDSLQLPADLYWPYAAPHYAPHYARSSVEHNESRQLTLDMSSSSELTGRGRGRDREATEGCGARAAPALLLHINLVLVLYGGAGLSTAARLKWDPTLYVAVRELFPREFPALAGALPAAGAALLVLAHVAAAAASMRHGRPRQVLYVLYAVGMGALLLCEAALCWWASVQLASWLHSQQSQLIRDLAAINTLLKPYMTHMPPRLHDLMQEVEADLPYNGYMALGAAALLVVLQVSALVLAVLAAVRARAGRSEARSHRSDSTLRGESAPLKLKAVYRDGKLTLV